MSQGPVWDFLILHRRLIQVIFNSNSCYCSYGYIVTCCRWHKHFYNVCVADEGVGFNAMSFIGSVTGLNILLTDFLSPKLSFVSLWYFSSYLLSVFGFEELYIITHCIQLVLFFSPSPSFFNSVTSLHCLWFQFPSRAPPSYWERLCSCLSVGILWHSLYTPTHSDM